VSDDDEKLAWPRWNWRESSWWLTTAGAAGGFAVLLIPSLTTADLRTRIIAATVAVVALPLILLVIIHLIRTASVAVRRAAAFPELTETVQTTSEQLVRARSAVTALAADRPELPRFEIYRVLNHGSTVTIAVTKSRRKLDVGDILVVVDTTDGVVLGDFQVSEIRSDVYRTTALTIDPLWAGSVIQSHQPETLPPPGVVALLKKKDSNDRD
jgi:hypothetical protein